AALGLWGVRPAERRRGTGADAGAGAAVGGTRLGGGAQRRLLCGGLRSGGSPTGGGDGVCAGAGGRREGPEADPETGVYLGGSGADVCVSARASLSVRGNVAGEACRGGRAGMALSLSGRALPELPVAGPLHQDSGVRSSGAAVGARGVDRGVAGADGDDGGGGVGPAAGSGRGGDESGLGAAGAVAGVQWRGAGAGDRRGGFAGVGAQPGRIVRGGEEGPGEAGSGGRRKPQSKQYLKAGRSPRPAGEGVPRLRVPSR